MMTRLEELEPIKISNSMKFCTPSMSTRRLSHGKKGCSHTIPRTLNQVCITTYRRQIVLTLSIWESNQILNVMKSSEPTNFWSKLWNVFLFCKIPLSSLSRRKRRKQNLLLNLQEKIVVQVQKLQTKKDLQCSESVRQKGMHLTRQFLKMMKIVINNKKLEIIQSKCHLTHTLK